VLTDIILGLASGMTIKFFPLFFKNECGLTVSGVQGVYIATYLVMAAFAEVARRAATRVGRTQTILACALCGVSLLVVMAVLGRFDVGWAEVRTADGTVRRVETHPLWRAWYVIVPVYVARTAIMNCCRGLRKSIVMDYVSKKDRGKWNALDGVTKLGWSGSAFLGGWLVDNYGYEYAFVATAVLQAIASSVWLLLIPLVPIEGRLQPIEGRLQASAEDPGERGECGVGREADALTDAAADERKGDAR
jgi:MFS family permease